MSFLVAGWRFLAAGLQFLRRWSNNRQSSPAQFRKRLPASAALRVEALESRDVPSTLNWTVPDSGGEYRLTLDDQQLTLAQADGTLLFQAGANAATVEIFGSPAAEQFYLDFETTDPSTGLQVSLHTLGGGDLVEITLSAQLEAVRLAPKFALITTLGYAQSVDGAETIRVLGNGGADSLEMTDGPGEDSLEAGPGHVLMQQPGVYLNDAEGFNHVTVDVNPAEPNRALVEGSIGGDTVTMSGSSVHVTLLSGLWQGQLSGFTRVSVDVETGSGDDTLVLKDSILSDELTFWPNHGILRRGDGIEHSFQGFPEVTFTANSGGKNDRDVAHLFDGPGMESFRAAGNRCFFVDGKDAFILRILYADEVVLDGSAGGLNFLSVSSYAYKLRVTGFRSADGWRFAYPLTRAQALFWIKRIALRLEPSLATAGDKMELAVMLRDFVHHRVRTGSNSTAWPQFDAYERFRQTIVSRQEGVSCQGAAWLYRDLLNAFGIQAREVSLFSSTYRPNHASVEIFLAGHWFVMDPTFNVSFKDANGNLLSYAQLRNKGTWIVDSNGGTNRGRWTINRVVPYRNYLHYIEYPALYV